MPSEAYWASVSLLEMFLGSVPCAAAAAAVVAAAVAVAVQVLAVAAL